MRVLGKKSFGPYVPRLSVPITNIGQSQEMLLVDNTTKSWEEAEINGKGMIVNATAREVADLEIFIDGQLFVVWSNHYAGTSDFQPIIDYELTGLLGFEKNIKIRAKQRDNASTILGTYARLFVMRLG